MLRAAEGIGGGPKGRAGIGGGPKGREGLGPKTREDEDDVEGRGGFRTKGE